MIVVNVPVGNIHHDERLAAKLRRRKAADNCELLHLSRTDMERFRIRRNTDKGTDIIVVRQGTAPLRNGDVLVDSKVKFVVVEQLPELVISAAIKHVRNNKKAVEVAALISHNIGNKHRPMAVRGGVIAFPAIAESELETFKQLAKPFKKYVRLTISRKPFEPNSLNAVQDHVE